MGNPELVNPEKNSQPFSQVGPSKEQTQVGFLPAGGWADSDQFFKTGKVPAGPVTERRNKCLSIGKAFSGRGAPLKTFSPVAVLSYPRRCAHVKRLETLPLTACALCAWPCAPPACCVLCAGLWLGLAFGLSWADSFKGPAFPVKSCRKGPFPALAVAFLRFSFTGWPWLAGSQVARSSLACDTWEQVRERFLKYFLPCP